MPEGIAGSRADRNCFLGKGIGRVFAELKKSAETRTMPEGIAGSRADRNCFLGKGIGRVFAELKIGE